MKILAVDQARHGAWAVFDYESKKLIDYGTWAFENRNYTFEQAILHIETLINDVIHAHSIGAVFFEDIQLRQNVQSFKKLAQMQGVLVNLCEKEGYAYGLVAPTQWQNFCNARGRTTKEIRSRTSEIELNGKKTSKILSLQFVRDKFGIETDNDNLSDAIAQGWYVVNEVQVINGETKNG